MGFPANSPWVLQAIDKGMLRSTETSKTSRFIVPMPPTTNHLFSNPGKRKGRVRSRKYREWSEAVASILSAVPKVEIYPVHFCILLMPGEDWRQGSDVSNRIKALEDAIVNAGILNNDNCTCVSGVTVGMGDPINGRSLAAFWFETPREWWK